MQATDTASTRARRCRVTRSSTRGIDTSFESVRYREISLLRYIHTFLTSMRRERESAISISLSLSSTSTFDSIHYHGAMDDSRDIL